MLVGNKSDLSANRKTPKELGEEYAKEEGLLFAEASAKSGDGVEDLFMEIGECAWLCEEGCVDVESEMSGKGGARD